MKRSAPLFWTALVTFAFFNQATNAVAQMQWQPAGQAFNPNPANPNPPWPSSLGYNPVATAAAAPKTREVIPGAMDVRFRDGSTLKVKLKDKQVEFETPYGRLMIPPGDILKIDVGVHTTAEDRKRIDSALSDLGHTDG
jgi:hypothetical protein